MGALLLRACDVLGRPLDDEMDVFVVSPQTETTAASLRSARGRVSIRFEGLSEGQPYVVRLFPKRHRPVAQIVTAGPDAELPDYYALCSAFAMPSKREGFGIVYLEAMACGKPAIAGDRDGARDALLDGEIGVLVDPDDVGAFAAAAVEVLSGRHPNRAIYDPARLRRRVIESFGPERFRARLEQILDTRGVRGRS